MAYNPFSIFRRNQKAIFAVVTVVIMFMFVLSSGMTGKADFFNWLPEWVRGKAKKGDALCVLDGDRIYPRDLEVLRRQRMMASKFMIEAAQETGFALNKELIELKTKATPQVVQKVQTAAMMEQFGQAGSVDRSIQEILDSPLSKEADKEMARLMRVSSSLFGSLGIAQRAGTYFATAANRPGNDRDVVEFMLWEKKAAQMGIEFSEDNVKQLIQKEFMGFFPSDVNVRKAMEREFPGFTLEACLKALAAEFRVRSAQTALLGLSTRSDHTLTALPLFNPVYELFEFYREKSSPTSYQLLRVPVESFLPLVTETPSDNELRRLFDERKDYEPDPSKEEAGFRDPRRVKVEWVSVTGEEPYYKKSAADWMTRTEMLAKSEVRGLLVPIPGMGPAAWAAQTFAPGAIKEPLAFAEYEHKKAQHRVQLDTNWERPTFSNLLGPLHAAMDTSVVKPQNLAALAGGIAGSTLGFAGPYVPGNLLTGAVVSAEQRGRIKAAMPLFMGSIPGPGMFSTMVASEAAFRTNLPEPLPIEAYKPLFLTEMSEKKARDLAVDDLKKLKESIDKLTETGKARESAAKDLVADFIKTRGVKTGVSADLQGEHTIGDDPGLAPLKALKDKGLDGSDPHSGRGAAPLIPFGDAFFWFRNQETGRRESSSGNYKPDFYPEGAARSASSAFAKADPVFLAWRTEDKQAVGLQFTAAKPRVIEAWKRIKARDLAKAEAERLANELRTKPGESELFMYQNLVDMQAQLQAKSTDPKAREKVKLFRLDNVAPMPISPDFSGRSMSGSVAYFRVTPTKDIPYPTADLHKALIEERTKPPKTVFTQSDRPKDSYYVIALLNRTVYDDARYRHHMMGLAAAFGGNQVHDGIAGEFQREAFGKARETVLGMLKKEFKYVETDEQKKRLDDKEKKGAASEE